MTLYTRIFLGFLFFVLAVFAGNTAVIAQDAAFVSESLLVSSTASTSSESTVLSAIQTPKQDVTRPEENIEKEKILSLFEERPASSFSGFNGFAYVIQRSVKGGVPANILVLLLLVPFLATLYAFLHHIVGLTSLEMLPSIILAVTLLATGIIPGLILLGLLFAAAFITHIIVKRIRIMHIPKMALSLFFVSMIVLIELVITVYFEMPLILNLSIFPLLLFVLLSDSIVSLYLKRPVSSALMITATTILFGVLGYYIMASEPTRNAILLYPELVLLTIPLNIIIGRFFGLRLTEKARFRTLLKKS